MRTLKQAITELNSPPEPGRPALAGQVLYAAFHEHGLHQARSDYMAGGNWALVIPTPDNGEIWVSDNDADLDYPADEHTGWVAVFQPSQEMREQVAGSQETYDLYSSSSRDCAADSRRCATAVASWLRHHPTASDIAALLRSRTIVRDPEQS